MDQDNITGKINHELWLILAAANDDTAKTQKLLKQPVNWDLLLKLSVHHRVYPLVYKTLSQLNNPAVPEHILDFLRQKYQENAMQALSMTGETVRMVKCFESHGIHAVVLKGAPLACRLYGDIAIRPSRDIDILVPPDELEKTLEILENEGYCETQPEYPEYNFTSRQLQIFSKAFSHSFHVSYRHSTKNVYIEIHWKLGNSIHELPFPNESNIKRIGVAGSPQPVLSDEEWLLYLMLHGAGHGWFRLRWLVDIAKFIQQGGTDWEKTASLAKSFGIQSFFHQSLILANQLLAVPVPPNHLSVVAHDRWAWRLAYMAMNLCLSAADYEIRRSDGQYTKNWRRIYGFHVRTGWKKRFNYLLKDLFSPTVYDVKLVSLPDRLYALYYAIRPFTFLGRRLRKFRVGN